MTDIDALLDAFGLKEETRTGWELRGVEEPESVAAHTWGAALLAFLFADEAGVDRAEAVQMAIVHDLGEAEVGDLPLRHDREKEKQDWSPEEKAAAERDAIEGFVDGLDDQRIEELWGAYERRDTAVARFVKDMDMIDMCLQALIYEQEGRYDEEATDAFEAYDGMDEFFATTEDRLSTATGEQLFQDIHERYREVRG